jgi:hypothetical protein
MKDEEPTRKRGDAATRRYGAAGQAAKTHLPFSIRHFSIFHYFSLVPALRFPFLISQVLISHFSFSTRDSFRLINPETAQLAQSK